MNRREKIIVGVMIFAIVVGGIYFLAGGSGGGAGDPGDDPETLNRFVVDVAKTINQKDNKLADYVLEKASAGWQRDPFLGQEAKGGAAPERQTGAKKTAGASSREFSCKGYVVAGNKRLVVINGLAYESGDLIEPEGYRIGAITDKQVVIEKRSGEIIVLHLDDKL